MIDVCWIVRPGDSNPELLYSLRSVSENLPHRHAVIAGYAPSWTRVDCVLPLEQGGTKHANALANLRAIATCRDLTQTVAIFNDDMYVMESLEQLPLLHCGPLEAAAQMRVGTPFERPYADTMQILRRKYQAFCYDLHTPILVDRSRLLLTLNRIDAYGRIAGWPTERRAQILWKTVYGNTLHPHGTYSPNVKVVDLHDEPAWPSPLLSTVDLAFQYGAVGRHIRDTFPTPCQYEAVT